MKGGTLYDTLEIARSATAFEIRTAYRLLAMKSHPAHAMGSDAVRQFVSVSSAFMYLANAETREQYDKLLDQGPASLDVKANQLTQAQAERLFAKEMASVAWELAEAGYTAEFIEQALVQEGCPVRIASTAARGTEIDAQHSQGLPSKRAPAEEKQRLERALLPEERAGGGGKAHSQRARWIAVGAALIACASAYAFIYRPYVAAQEAEARRIMIERELAAATAARIAAEEEARIAARQQEEERIRRAERFAAWQMQQERQARQAEYEACLKRLMTQEPPRQAEAPRPPPNQPPAYRASSSFGQAMADAARGLGEYQAQRYNNNVASARAKLAIAAQETCQRILTR